MNNIFKILFLITFVNLAYSGNLPTLGNVSPNQIMQSTGSNFILVPVSDNDISLTQNVTVTAFSSNSTILQVNSIDFDNLATFAKINVTEQGIAGVVTITVQAVDSDGTATKEFEVVIDNFYNRGANFQVYNLAHFLHYVPTSQAPGIDTIITQTSIPKNESFYKNAKLSEFVGGFPPYDITYISFTDVLSGYIVASVSGTYTFKLVSSDSSVFYLNTTNGANLKSINFIQRIDCESFRCDTKEYSIDLVAGQYYPFKAVNWLSYVKNFAIVWSGPGINTYRTIDGSNLYPDYDLIKPSAPTALSFVNKGVEFVTLKWNRSTDNRNVTGYNVYMDGAKIAMPNDTLFVVTGLGNNTFHSFAVTANDKIGNESLLSNVVSNTTYPTDITSPLPPTTITFISLSDVSAEISWSGASDVGSEIIGYNVYLNGVLFAAQKTVNPSSVLKVLIPNSSYNVSVEAVDGAFNVSAKSAASNFKTLKFNPLTISTGVKKLRANIFATRYARNPGFGLNFDWSDPIFYNNNPSILRQHIGDFKPSILRWGNEATNASNFSAYTGTGKPVTIAKFMRFCVKNNAYAQFTCGVNSNTDWRTDPATFTRFMEYMGDRTGQTAGGALRISEGYISPPLDSLKGLVFEFGHEVWTLNSGQLGGSYANYAQWCRSVAGIIKSSPYYDSTKISLSYSGRDPDAANSYGLHTQLLNGDHHEVDWLSLSGYLPGYYSYDAGVSLERNQLNYYRAGTANMLSNLTGLKDLKTLDAELTGRERPFYFYQSNMTSMEQSERLGQAVILGDYFFSAQKMGLAAASVFTLNGGEWGIVDAQNGYAKLPLFNLSELLNTNTKGNILKSTIQTVEFLKNGSDQKILGDPVGVHVFNNGMSYAIALFSRDFVSDYQVQLNMPDGQAYSNQAKKYVFTGTDFNAKASMTNFSMVPFSDSMVVTVPKYSVVLYVFDGPDLGLPLLPIGYTKDRKIESLKIVNISGSPYISSQNGSATFTVSGIALNIINKNVIWKITKPDTMDATITTLAGIKIISNGTCKSNGVLSLKVMSAEDTTVFDKINVTISGQLTSGMPSCNIIVIDTIPEAITPAANLFVNIFPNPTDGVFHLKSNIAGKLNIYNLIGVKVRSIDKKITEATIEGLSSGIYILEFTTESRKWTRKVVVK